MGTENDVGPLIRNSTVIQKTGDVEIHRARAERYSALSLKKFYRRVWDSGSISLVHSTRKPRKIAVKTTGNRSENRSQNRFLSPQENSNETTNFGPLFTFRDNPTTCLAIHLTDTRLGIGFYRYRFENDLSTI